MPPRKEKVKGSTHPPTFLDRYRYLLSVITGQANSYRFRYTVTLGLTRLMFYQHGRRGLHS